MASTGHVYPVPEAERRPVPAWAQAWGKDVDYPAPGLITEELQQNIHIDSIFVKSGELIIPDKCEECRLRAKGCDRARPLCGRCEKIGKTCIPVTNGYSRLRKGRGGKALPIRVWGQSEDPEKIDRDREERERLERERVERELKAREAREAREAKELTLNMAGIVGPTRKRKRTESMPATTKQAYTSSLPPSRGHYVDYSSLSMAYATQAATTIPFSPISPHPQSAPALDTHGDIPIDPLLLNMSEDARQTPKIAEPVSKRARTSLSPPASFSTGSSTPTSTDVASRRQASLSMSSLASPSTPYDLANLSLHSLPSPSKPTTDTMDVSPDYQNNISKALVETPSQASDIQNTPTTNGFAGPSLQPFETANETFSHPDGLVQSEATSQDDQSGRLISSISS